MILGIAGLIVGWFFVGLLSLAAVITGHIAQRKEPHARAFWLTGLITGYLAIIAGIGVIIIWIVLVVTQS